MSKGSIHKSIMLFYNKICEYDLKNVYYTSEFYRRLNLKLYRVFSPKIIPLNKETQLKKSPGPKSLVQKEKKSL